MLETLIDQLIQDGCHERIVEDVVELAYGIFCRCGAKSDFCLQTIGQSAIVFGGTNRLKWSPMHGFRPDRSLCTPRFLTVWDEHFAN